MGVVVAEVTKTITEIGTPIPKQHEEFELTATVKMARDTGIIPAFWQQCGEISGSEHLKTIGVSMVTPGVFFFFSKEKVGDDRSAAIYSLDVRAALQEALNIAEMRQRPETEEE